MLVLWTHRDVLTVLATREFKPRYRQMVLGIVWVILQPLVAALIFTIVFGRLAGVSSGGTPYVVGTYCAMVCWTFFSGAVSRASQSLVAAPHLVTKVYVPRVLIPTSSMLLGYLDVAVSFGVIVSMMAVYDIPFTWKLVAFPALLVLLSCLTFAISLWLSSLNVFYRDVTHATPVMLQIWLFATPVAYPATLIPESWRWLAALNPMTACTEGFREVFVGHSALSAEMLAVSCATTMFLLLGGLLCFRRIEHSIADRI